MSNLTCDRVFQNEFNVRFILNVNEMLESLLFHDCCCKQTSDGATSRTASKVAASKSVTDQCSVDGLFNGHLGQAAATDKLTAE
jgi:hypothetical protein